MFFTDRRSNPDRREGKHQPRHTVSNYNAETGSTEIEQKQCIGIAFPLGDPRFPMQSNAI